MEVESGESRPRERYLLGEVMQLGDPAQLHLGVVQVVVAERHVPRAWSGFVASFDCAAIHSNQSLM